MTPTVPPTAPAPASYDRAALGQQLKLDEGLRLKPYRDTKDKLTIGIGRNLMAVGISRAEAMVFLDHDIAQAIPSRADALKALGADPTACRLTPYRDAAGKLLIGVLRNLSDQGISEDEAFLLLDNDITRTEHLLDANAPWWTRLDPVRQAVLMNMCFNMGWGDGLRGLSSFHNMLRLAEAGDFAGAGKAMLASSWAGEVGGGRSMRLSREMAAGQPPVVGI